jgi:hypothetical protein
VTVSARSYRAPEIDVFRFEIRSIATAAEASEIAIQIREETGEPASVSIDTLTSTWTIEIGTPKESIEEAAAFKAMLDEKGIQDAVMTAERRLRPSRDAVALSHQVRSAGKSEVRSLIRPTGDVQPALGDAVAAGLREVIVSGASEQARYASLKAVSFGSFDERANPVRLNGKAYRGKLEVFVNARGTLTVVNVVPLEEYLLGVVPSLRRRRRRRSPHGPMPLQISTATERKALTWFRPYGRRFTRAWRSRRVWERRLSARRAG